jgi:putative transposase
VPRPPRIQAPGLRYHVTSRGCAKRAIYLSDFDRLAFESILADVIERFEWTCESFTLMTTHYHLQLQTRHANLAAGMQRLNSRFGAYFNHRHDSEGHLFFRRYHSEVITTEAHHLEVCRYIALNPVRAGLCGRPAAWPWSTYGETIGRRFPRPYVSSEVLLRIFGEDRSLARARYQSFVERAA